MGYYPQNFDISEALLRNLALFGPNAKQKQITLKSSFQEGLFAYADEKMVDAVVRNLISNALKFTHAHGHVEVAITQDDRFLEVSVSDTGVGISPEVLQKLFRIDEKCRNLGTAGERGTGLGLILCKELVEKGGGKIWVKSEVRKGTSFTFTIPKSLGHIQRGAPP